MDQIKGNVWVWLFYSVHTPRIVYPPHVMGVVGSNEPRGRQDCGC